MKKRRLEDRLFLMKPIKNGVGRFIPYCLYERHKGILTHNEYINCERKNCRHYLRLYLTYKSKNVNI